MLAPNANNSPYFDPFVMATNVDHPIVMWQVVAPTMGCGTSRHCFDSEYYKLNLQVVVTKCEDFDSHDTPQKPFVDFREEMVGLIASHFCGSQTSSSARCQM